MIIVQADKCTGCGDCVAVCPTSAISLLANLATIDQRRCTGCEACMAACPNGAIVAVEKLASLPAVRPTPEVVAVKPQPSPIPWSARVWPAVGTALAVLGREIVPRVATYLADTLEQRMAQQPPSVSPVQAARGGRRSRHRRRGP
jgi:Fe-S-cluster-containing hydrogenase component 2